MSQENEQQIEHWNGDAGVQWVAAQTRMDAFLAPLSRVLLERAAARGGERVLDVGCGCGDTSLALSGVGAQVLGLDISAPMLTRARQRSEGRYGLKFVHADALDYPLEPSSFDLLISRFGVMFFADATRAFTNLRRGHAKDGRLCVMAWQAMEHNPWFSQPASALQPFLAALEPAAEPTLEPTAEATTEAAVEPAKPAVKPAVEPGPFAFADSERVAAMLAAAGYHDVAAEPVHQSLRYGETLEDAMSMITHVGPAARGLALLPEDARAAALEAVHEVLRAAQGPDGVVFPAAAWIFTARASKR